MVNLTLVALISVCLGFLAGSMFSTRNETPLSKKEAVTGDVEAPAKSYVIPRPWGAKEDLAKIPAKEGSQAQAENKVPALPPQYCEAGTTLQEQLLRMKFLELRQLCDNSEREWVVANIESIYKFGEEEDSVRKREFDQRLKDLARTSSRWKAQTTVTQGDRAIEVDVLLDIYKSDNPTNEMRKQIAINTWTEMDSACYVFEPFFTVNGKVQGLGSMSSCEGVLPKKGEVSYFKWHTYADAEISPAVSVFMFPFPPTTAGLDYLASANSQWLTQNDFRWVQTTEAEIKAIRERYAKKLEQQRR